MSDRLSVMSRTQIIYVEPASGAVAVINVGPMGPAGPPGESTGDPGPPGDPGVGVPTGGTTGQVLTKDSATDYDTSWQTPTGGGASLPITASDTSADLTIGGDLYGEDGAWYTAAVGNNDVAGSGYRAAQIAVRADPGSDTHLAGVSISTAGSNGVSTSSRADISTFIDKTNAAASQIELIAGQGTRLSGLWVTQNGVELFTQLDPSAPAPVLDLMEVPAAPGAPAANKARLFARDNGSGKTQLCVRFPTGAVQVLATEP